MKINNLSQKILSNSFYIFIMFLIISIIIFLPSLLNLNFFWDDERFIFLNPAILQSPNWYVFWNSKSEFYKSWPLGYSIFWIILKYVPTSSLLFFKLLNIIIHALNATLVFKLLSKMNFKYYFFGAFLFLIHPLHVESVSWIFQLLTLVSFTFFIITLIFIYDFLQFKNPLRILLAFLFFIFSLWTKSIALLCPFLFLMIFFIKKTKFSNYLYLIPFFLASFYIGLVNVKGTAIISNQNTELNYFSKSFFNVIDENIKTLMPNAVNISKTDSSREYFNYLYGSKNAKNISYFEGQQIFSQGIWHYLLKTIMPFDLRYIYPIEKINYLKVVLSLTLLIFIPCFYFYKKKERVALLIPSMTFSFLTPYLGVTAITFFYWSPVSDRYTYFFILVFSVVICMLENSFKKAKHYITAYLLILIPVTVLTSFDFNDQITVYKKSLESKSHPAFYSLLFEQYLLTADAINARNILDEGIGKFPTDKNLNNDLVRLKAFEDSMD